jgi:hypothetical protein
MQALRLDALAQHLVFSLSWYIQQPSIQSFGFSVAVLPSDYWLPGSLAGLMQ